MIVKVLATLESTVGKLNDSEADCVKLREEVQLLQVHTEQIMEEWGKERELAKVLLLLLLLLCCDTATC